MTRKDYELIAAVLRDSKSCAESDAEHSMARLIAIKLADEFSDRNVRFNRNAWFKAVGLLATPER